MDAEKGELNQELEQVIKQELECISELENIMSVEKEAISTSDTEKLQHILEQKKPVLIHMKTLERKRNETLTLHSITPSAEALTYFMAQCHSKSLVTLWESLKVRLRECKQTNEVNGRLIQIKKSNNESVLKILLGNWQTKGQTYSASGMTTEYSKSGLCAVA